MAVLNDLLQKIVHCLGWEYNGTCTLPEANSSHLKTFLGVCLKKTCWDIEKEALLDFQKSLVALDSQVTDVDNEQSPPVERSTPGWFCVLSPPAAPRTCNVSPSGPSIHDVAAPIEQWSDVISWFPRLWWFIHIGLIEKSRRDKHPYCERSRISWSLTGLWTLFKWKEVLRAPIVLGWNFGWWNPTRRIMKSPMKCNSSYSPTRKSERGQWYFFWFKLGCCCSIR